jgi:hypothetical protein
LIVTVGRQLILSPLESMAGTTGLEPATSAVTGQHSNQLNYVPAMQLNGLRKIRVVIDDRKISHTVHISHGMHGMVAFSALTAHQPPVRNRELVTGQIIARNARSGFRRRSIFPPMNSLPRIMTPL